MFSFCATTLLIAFAIQEYVQETTAINCYNYHLSVSQSSADPTLIRRGLFSNCQPERRLLHVQYGFLQADSSNSSKQKTYGACITLSFYETNGQEVIVGYCAGGDRCPSQFGGKNCLYPDGRVVTRMITQMTGISNPTAVCCCENDFCNAPGDIRLTPVRNCNPTVSQGALFDIILLTVANYLL
jgi:hypothetical protein